MVAATFPAWSYEGAMWHRQFVPVRSNWPPPLLVQQLGATVKGVTWRMNPGQLIAVLYPLSKAGWLPEQPWMERLQVSDL